jgi:hypothetical protein
MTVNLLAMAVNGKNSKLFKYFVLVRST